MDMDMDEQRGGYRYVSDARMHAEISILILAATHQAR